MFLIYNKTYISTSQRTTSTLFKLLPVIFFLTVLVACSKKELKPEMVIVRQAKDIVLLDSIKVKPVVYHNEMNFKRLPVEKKKEHFISMILPEVLMVKHNIELARKRIGHILYEAVERGSVTAADSSFMMRYMTRLKARTWDEVYRRMAVHPTSIVLAQAVIESGWGSSRFFNEGNNLFGVWSYNTEENRIIASQSRDTGAVYLRSYHTIGESIEDYFYILARGNAYSAFRKARIKEGDPLKLIFHLKPYSELGYQYVNKLSLVIRQNNLTQYDDYQLDSAYINRNSPIVY